MKTASSRDRRMIIAPLAGLAGVVLVPLVFLAAGHPAAGSPQGLAWAAIVLGLCVALMAALGAGMRDRALRAPAAAFGIAVAVGGVAHTLVPPGQLADAVSVGATVVSLIAAVLLFRRSRSNL